VLLTVYCVVFGGVNCRKPEPQGRNMQECVKIDDKTLCAFVGD
jgi:hypothetical protein